MTPFDNSRAPCIGRLKKFMAAANLIKFTPRKFQLGALNIREVSSS